MKVLVSIFCLALSATAAATTQTSFDYALSCCWTGSPGSFCTTQAACSNGQAACDSKYFYGFDAAFNHRYHVNDGYIASMHCGALSPRGDESDALTLFVAPPPLETSDGETLEVSDAVATSLHAATKVMELQRRGASNEELKSAVSDDVDLGIEAADDGTRIITIRGEGADDIVLRFDDDGKLQLGEE